MKILKIFTLSFFFLLMPTPGWTAPAVEKGSIKVVSTKFGFPQISLRPPTLAPGETIESMVLMRSTSDLSRCLDIRTYPIARIGLDSEQSVYSDEDAPQGVDLFYRLAVTTNTKKKYLSNVQSTRIQVPQVPELRDPVIVVDKANYTLSFADQNYVYRVFPIALGAHCFRRKLELDRASTPEGEYRIAGLQPQATFYRAIDINYPNVVDKVRYRFHADEGLIEEREGGIGGEIQIHGHGIDENWTWGCVALRDQDMDWLFSRPELKNGLPVQIVGWELKAEDLVVEESLTRSELSQLKDLLRRTDYLVGDREQDWYYALNLFQRINGLPVTGILDVATKNHLFSVLGK